MGSGSAFSFKSLVLVSLVAAWASWLGYNGMVSIPAYLLMGAVFITDAQPGSAIFESWRWVTETSAGFLVPKPHWNVVEYTFKGALKSKHRASVALLRVGEFLS